MSLHQRIECARVRLAGAMDRLAAAEAALRQARAGAGNSAGRACRLAVQQAEHDCAAAMGQVRLRRTQLEDLLLMRQGDLFAPAGRVADGQEKTPPAGAG